MILSSSLSRGGGRERASTRGSATILWNQGGCLKGSIHPQAVPAARKSRRGTLQPERAGQGDGACCIEGRGGNNTTTAGLVRTATPGRAPQEPMLGPVGEYKEVVSRGPPAQGRTSRTSGTGQLAQCQTSGTTRTAGRLCSWAWLHIARRSLSTATQGHIAYLHKACA